MPVRPPVARARRTAGVSGRVFVASAGAVVAVMVWAGPAAAHVTVHPASLPAGSSDVELVFRVPNERDDTSTVKLQVFLPASAALPAVDVLPVPGWTSSVDTRTLARPRPTDDGPVGTVVSDVTWAASGSGIGTGQYEDFAIEVGQLPTRAGPLVFKALQTYSSGEIVRWIEVPSSQDPSPDSPAPVLTLTAPPSTTVRDLRAPAASSTTSGAAVTLAGVAVGLSVAAMVGVGVLALRRRPVRP